MTYFIDTSYLIALVHTGDDLHARAKAWRDAINRKATRLFTTEYVLVELVNFFSDRHERRLGRQMAEALRNSSDVQIITASTQLLTDGLKLHGARDDKDWSLTDCISFVVMNNQRLWEALSGDIHFRQAGFRALLLESEER